MAATAKRSVNIYVNGKEVEDSLKNINKEIARQREEWSKLKKGTQEYLEKAEEIKRLKTLQEEYQRSLVTTDEKIRDIRNSFLRLGAGLGGFTQVLTTVKNAMNFLRDFAADLAKLDDRMHLVRKTTGLTMGQIQDLNKEFMKIDTRTSREELNDLAYAAGKLGISTKDGVLQFVKAADEINVALGDVLGGTDSIIEITKMMEVFRQSTKEIAGEDLQQNLIRTGSVLNELGKRSTANEKNMAAFLGRISGVSSQLGISLDQAAGYASVFDQTKQHVEMSATALQRMFTEMIKRPGEYAKAAGMELEKFMELTRTDFNEAAIKVLEGFGRAGGMEPLVKAFKDMGLDGQRAVAAITQLASHTDMLRTAQQQANEALREGTSTGREYATMNESMQAKMEKARKSVQDARIELGEKMYPATLKVLSVHGRFIKWLTELTQKTTTLRGIAAGATLWIARNTLETLKKLTDRLSNTTLAVTMKTIAQRKELAAQKEAVIAEKQRILQAARLEAEQARLAAHLNATAEANKRLAASEAKVAAAEKAVAAAQQARNNLNALNLLKANWMAVAQAVIFAATWLANFIRKQTEASRKAREMNAELAQERQRINALFSAYKDLNTSAEKRAEILETIKDRYGEYLRNLTDEKGNLLDIANAQRIVNAEKEKEIRLKYAGEAEETIRNDYKDLMGRQVRKIMEATDGKLDMTAIYNWISENQGDASNGLFDKRKLEKMSPLIRGTVEAKESQLLYMIQENLEREGMQAKKASKAAEKARFWVGRLYLTTANMNRAIEASNKLYGTTGDTGTKPYTAGEVFINGDRTQSQNLPGAGDSEGNILDRWQRLLDRIADLNQRYNIKETPMSKAKQQLETDYEAMIRDVQEFYRDNAGYTQKGQEEIKKLEREMWRQIYRIDKEERRKAIGEIDERLKDVTNRMEAFRLKQRRKSQSQLETDLEEIGNDFKRLTDKIQREADALRDSETAGQTLTRVLSSEATPDSEELKEDVAWLEKYGITLKKIAELKEKLRNGKTTGDILTELGIGLDEEQARKLEDLLRLIGETVRTGLEEKAVRIRENTEDISRQYMSTGRKAFEERKKAIETQIMSVEASIRYYEEIGADEGKLEALKMTREELEEELERLRKLREKLEKETDMAQKKALGQGGGVWDMFGIRQEDWEDWQYNWQDNLERIASTIQTWWNQISDMVGAAMELQSAAIEKQTKEIERQYEERSDEFRVMLENNIISQKYYDAQMERLNKEKEEREKRTKHTQFETERGSKIAEALMNGALAVTSIWSKTGVNPIVAAILTAIAGATNAIQVAAIASQPNPYAKGSYIRGPQIALMGEEGDEWVASNKLLRDRKTAAIIAALDDYQRGNALALKSIRLNAPEPRILSHGTQGKTANFAPSNTTYNYYQNTESQELLNEIRLVRKYLEDPRNRQATINRNILLEYERLENSVKEMARL